MEKLNSEITSLKEKNKKCFEDCEGACKYIENNKCNCKNVQFLYWLEELKSYKNASKQGLLLRLPYPLETKRLYFADDDSNDVYELNAKSLYVSKEEGKIVYEYDCFRFHLEHFGKNVFLSQEEAEQALAKMQTRKDEL